MTTSSWITDPFRGSAPAARAAGAAEARDRAGLEAAIAAAQPTDRSVLIVSVATTPGVVDWLVELLRETPDDLWLNTIAAEAYLHWAWEARTGARAKDVTQEGWEAFRARSEAAADVIAHVRTRHSDPSLIGLPALRACLAGQGDADDMRRALVEAETAYPYDYWTARMGVDYFAEKWYGSTPQMWDYAVTRAGASPDGAPTAALVAGAVVEQLLWARRSKGALPKREIASLLDEAATRTVGHAGWEWTPSAWGAVNELIVANLLLDRKQDARQLYAVLGPGRLTEWPWEVLDPAVVRKQLAMLAKTE